MNTQISPRESLLRSIASHTVSESHFVPLCYFDYFKNRLDYAALLEDTNPFTEERSIRELEYRIGFCRDIGAVFMDWITTQGYELRIDPSVGIEEESSQSIVTNTYTTPIGSLREVYRRNFEAKTSFLTEPLLKTPEDAKVYRYIIEAQSLDAGDTTGESGDPGEEEWLSAIGGSGIACQVSGSAPYHEVLHHYRPEEILVCGLDLPREVEELVEAIHQRNIGIAQHLAASSFAVIKFESLWDLGILSPQLLSRFYAPYLSEYCDILHRAGKITMDHASGQGIMGTIDRIAECGIDFLYGVEVRVDNAAKMNKLSRELEGKMLFCLGISPVDLWRMSLSELRTAWTMIAETIDSEAIFGTADAVVPGTEPERLKMAADLLCSRGGAS